jgi:hypothetical protein
LALALVVIAALWSAARGDFQPLVQVSPPVRKVRLRVGEHRQFIAATPGQSGRFLWLLDQRRLPVDGPTLDFVPQAADVGRHRLTLDADLGMGVVRRSWAIRAARRRPVPRAVGVRGR